MSVVSDHTMEAANHSDIRRRGKLQDSLKFIGIRGDLSAFDPIPEKAYLSAAYLLLGRIEGYASRPEFSQHVSQMPKVLLKRTGVYDDIVQVREGVLPFGIAEHPVDQALECTGTPAQTEMHTYELVQPPMASERSFAFIAGTHLDLQIPIAGIRNGELLCTTVV